MMVVVVIVMVIVMMMMVVVAVRYVAGAGVSFVDAQSTHGE